jgi:hypothetical protein
VISAGGCGHESVPIPSSFSVDRSVNPSSDRYRLCACSWGRPARLGPDARPAPSANRTSIAVETDILSFFIGGYPTAAYTYNNVYSGETSVNGTTYKTDKFSPNAALHVGWAW